MSKSRYIIGIIIIAFIVIITLIIRTNLKHNKVIQTINPQELKVSVLGLKGPTSIGMVKIFEDKPSLGAGVETNYDTVSSPDLLIPKLINKQVDFAALPTNVAAANYNKGIDYKIAAVTSWGVLYLVSTDDSVKDWSSLKGKTVNLTDKGATPDVVFRYLASKNGLNPKKDLTLDYTLNQAPLLAPDMIAGRVKIGVLPEPFATMVLQGNEKARIVLNFQNEWKKINGDNIPFAQTCLVVRNDFAKEHPEVVAKLLDEYKKSINWVNSNSSQAGELVEKNKIGIPAKVAESAIPRCNLKFEDAQQSKEAVYSFLNVILGFSPKDLGGKLPDENFFYKK